jgi:ADP-heptose:LPS heptosyltransferase
MATISHKRNCIVSLTDSNNNIIVDHDQKAQLLWTTFKTRLGISEFQYMAYDLSNLISAHNLEQLDADFSQEEIDLVIRELPNNNAPGPDGFNGLFIKRCWHTIRDDFTRLFTYVLIMLTSEASIHLSLH